MWAAAPVGDILWVSCGSDKAKPFQGAHQSTTLMGSHGSLLKLTLRWDLHVLLHIHSNMYLCRNGSQRCRPGGAGFPPCRLVGHKLESLILAQNERWRHA